MNTAEISQLLQITLEILKVDGGYGGGIKLWDCTIILIIHL